VLARRLPIVLLIAFFSRGSLATDCYGTTSLTGCFSVLGTTGPAEAGPFRTLSLGRTLTAQSFALSANTWHIIRPAELAVSSPDPAGRSIYIVSRATVIDWRAAVGIGSHMDLTLAVPVFMDVRGLGADAISTQKPSAFQQAALGDPRLGVRASLLPSSTHDFRLMLRNEWTLPLGNETHYAGDVSATSTLAVTGAYYHDGWSVAVDVGTRSVAATRFGDIRLGTSALFGFGFARDIITDNVLSVGLEAWANPVLVPAAKTDVPNSGGANAIPSEWLMNVQWHPESQPCWFWLGGGSALPLSHRNVGNAPIADSSYIAPSSARMRLGLGLGLMFGGT